MKFFVRLMRNLTGQGSGPSAGPIVDVTSRIAKDSRENEGSTLGRSTGSSRDVSQNLDDPRPFNQQPDLFNTYSGNAERSGMEEQQVPEMFAWPGDQFGSDSFWAEDTIDVDLLLQHGLCPLLPANFGAAPGVDTFNL